MAGSFNTDDVNKYINEYVERFNYYMNLTVKKVQNFTLDQFIALGTAILGLILIIVAIIIW